MVKAENSEILSKEREKSLKLEAERVLANHRRTLLCREPFIGSIAMNMEIVPVRDVRVRTACTDGKTIFFDLAFLSSLTSEEALFVFGHEIFHAVMMHFARTENRNRELMNIAADLEVNQILAKDGFSVPSHALTPASMSVPPDLAAEEYYEILQKNASAAKSKSDNEGKSGNGSGQFDKHIYSGDEAENGNSLEVFDKYGKVGIDPDFNPADPKSNVERVRESAVTAAQMVERTRGDMPAFLKQLYTALLKPEINWREQLQQFITRTCGGENRSWNPPNRRHVHSGIYLQSRKGEKIKIFTGLDVSGSTSQDIPKFLSELNGLVKTFGKYELSVAQCDTEIKSFKTYTDDDPLDLENEKFETFGGGGTRLSPIFEKVEELSSEEGKPDAIVILTDGYVEHFNEDADPGIPTLWLVSRGGAKNFTDFGDIVELKNYAEAS